ncbi:MAG TPA: hypothetical protein VIV37_09115 [Gaiellaceae bacterium]
MADVKEGRSWMRVIGARVLTVVAILLALVGMVAFYVEHTALDEEGFEAISRQMIENDEIRTQVAAKAVDTLFENVDVEAAIAERLPPAQAGLAPVLAGLARSGADRAADAALERPRVQTVWVEVTTRTQRQLVRLLDDDTTFIQTEGGAVVLDLRPIVIQIGDQVAVIGKVAERLPESSGKIAIIEESQLETAQTATKILRSVADWMWLVALVVAALAVWLARGRRRLELRAIALGLLVVGLLLLAVRRFAGDYLVDSLVKDDAVKPAGHDAWSILTQTLADRAWVWIILGVVTLLGVWFVGDSARAARARDAASPVLESRPTTYAIAAGALLALVLVAPQIARGWLSALLLIALIVAGIEVVRNIVLRDAQQPG